jgi:heptosyltransferase-1/heptosyltransferase-2
VPDVDLSQFAELPVRILAVKLSSFGDIVHVTGALRSLRRAFPQAELTLAVEHRWADVVRNNPHVTALIESSSWERLSMACLAEIQRHLAHRMFDIAIDFQGTRRSAAWVYLSGARFKLGRGGFRPGWRFTVETDRTRHAVVICAEVLRRAGLPVDSPDPEIRTSCADERRLDEFLDAERIPRAGFVLFNPFSRWVSKSWPEQNTAAFIGRFKKCFDHRLILTGGAGDRGPAERLLRLLAPGTIISLVGRLPLGQALCLFRRARLMVGCDSGPTHAAAAFGVPVVALFGPTHPEHTGPWGPNHRVVQARRPPEHHAYRSDAQAGYMRALDSGAVFEAVSDAIGGSA